MNTQKLDKLFDLIDLLVADEAPWSQKRDEIIAIAKADERSTNLQEFFSWFEEPIE